MRKNNWGNSPLPFGDIGRAMDWLFGAIKRLFATIKRALGRR